MIMCVMKGSVALLQFPRLQCVRMKQRHQLFSSVKEGDGDTCCDRSLFLLLAEIKWQMFSSSCHICMKGHEFGQNSAVNN